MVVSVNMYRLMTLRDLRECYRALQDEARRIQGLLKSAETEIKREEDAGEPA